MRRPRGPPAARDRRLPVLLGPPLHLAAPELLPQYLLVRGIVHAAPSPPAHRGPRKRAIHAQLNLTKTNPIAPIPLLIRLGVLASAGAGGVAVAGAALADDDGLAVGPDEPAANGAQGNRVAAVGAAGLLVVPRGRGLAEDAPEGALVERPAHRDADADERDGHFGGGPHDEAD